MTLITKIFQLNLKPRINPKKIGRGCVVVVLIMSIFVYVHFIKSKSHEKYFCYHARGF